MRDNVKWSATAIIMLLPASRPKNILLKLVGHHIEIQAKIGINFAIHLNQITMKKGAVVGNLNMFRNVNQLVLENEAKIGNLNWISAAPLFRKHSENGQLILRTRSNITNRHYLDVSGNIELMEESAIWGVRSTLMTHGIEPVTWEQTARKTTIGCRCVIGSNSIVVPGTRLPNGCYFGMGSLIAGEKFKSNARYINPKAKIGK